MEKHMDFLRINSIRFYINDYWFKYIKTFIIIDI